MSENLDTYQFINVEPPWELKGEMHELTNATPAVPPLQQKHNSVTFSPCNACLVLRVPPENRFRYRYDTEMSGTHGSLQGIRTGREKSVPTVELLNYPFEALIRVTLGTCKEGEHYPHPHSLFVKEKLYQKKIYENWDEKHLTKTGHYADPHYIRVGKLKNDYIARFEGMCIINSKKENFHAAVREKLQMRGCELKQGTFRDESEPEDERDDLSKRVEAAVSVVDVDFVSLCFEAFREENGKLFPICEPVYSEPIGNASEYEDEETRDVRVMRDTQSELVQRSVKLSAPFRSVVPNALGALHKATWLSHTVRESAKTGKLKISRINKCSGSCKGGDEIWLLVEKINKKGLVVRFSEEHNGKMVWESCIEGDDLILHHQYAIIFKTPPYKDVHISSEVEVLMRLERSTQPNQPCDYSEPITFVYEPVKTKTNKGDNLCRKESILTPLKQLQSSKRPRTESSSAGTAIYHQNKRRTDDLELEDMDFEDSDDDIAQLLFGGKDSLEFDQAWSKFNVEEFLRFISSDDVDMPPQKDGVAHGNKFRRDFFYKLYLLYSKLDENDIKKLTDQISNFRVSKKETAEKSGNDQVKDAASTLLTLRSKAMINNNNKPDFVGKPQNKMESLSLILGSNNESDLEAPSPKQPSVIKFNSPKTKTPPILTKNKKELVENDELWDLLERNFRSSVDDSGMCKVIKTEKDSALTGVKLEKLSKVYKVLNESGSWEHLADLWNCSGVVDSAKVSSNPAKYLFEFMEKLHGPFDLDLLRSSLNAISDKKPLRTLDETLVRIV